jgi:arginyl-tRNA synthetase
MAALKFFIIKVNPKKRMTFDPKESLDMQGQTGPYVQNAYVRIQSVLRKYNQDRNNISYDSYTQLQEEEVELMKLIVDYPNKIQEAGDGLDPSTIANYCYALAKEYHRFYHGIRILKAESDEAKSFRINLSKLVAEILKDAMDMLGIEMPSRM